jgi:guanylate kinase
VDVNQVIRDTVPFFQGAAGRQGIDTVLELDEQLPCVRFSRHDLQHIVLNLVNNSLEAMGESGSRVVISTRPGEEEGREYWFLTPEDFLARIEGGDFLEHVEYVSGHRYGTLRSELDRIQANGHVPLLELETEGALRVKSDVPGAVTIFISATVDELERRLRERATESTGEIGERIALAREQLDQAGDFDYIVRNEELEPAVEELVELVRGLLTPAGTMSRP